jgi:uncharacterized damage-inducible protein DinB
MGEPNDLKTSLVEYLRNQHDALLWKLDGLSERDVRRPLTPTGTNLLGLVKHSASMEAIYLGEVFDRPFPEPMPWLAPDAETNADMWATEDESIASIRAFATRTWEHAATTIDALDLDSPGWVRWWGDGGGVTLGHVLVHLNVEIARHTGHADIVRELIDGERGFLTFADNIPDEDEQWWAAYVARLDAIAQQAGR